MCITKPDTQPSIHGFLEAEAAPLCALQYEEFEVLGRVSIVAVEMHWRDRHISGHDQNTSCSVLYEASIQASDVLKILFLDSTSMAGSCLVMWLSLGLQRWTYRP